MRRFIAHVLHFIVLAAVPVVYADAGSSDDSLTLRETLDRTLRDSPVLKAESLQLEAVNARADAAGLRPPLTLHGDLENFAGTDATSGADVLEATLRLSAVVELGGRLGKRRDLAATEREAATAVLEARRLEVLAGTAERFIQTAAAVSALEVQRQETRLTETTVAAVERRISIGAAPRFELAKASIRLEHAKIREEHAEHELDARRRELAARWGARTPDFSSVQADLFTLPQTAEFAELVRRLDRNPDLQTLAAEERVASARLRLAEATRRPDVTVSAGVRRLEALDDTALVAGLSMPLGTRNRAAPGIREAAALQSRARVLQDARRLALETVLYELSLELGHARLEVETLRGPILEHAGGVLEQVEQGFRQGRFSFQELGLAQSELIDSQRSAIAAAARFHRLLVQIEQLTGVNAAHRTE